MNPRRPAPTGPKQNILDQFEVFLQIDLQKAKRTVKGHVREIRRFLSACDINPKEISKYDIRKYLSNYQNVHPAVYKNVLASIKVFFRDFMEMDEVVKSFRSPKKSIKIKSLPQKHDVQRFYQTLETSKERALYLMYATTGLRRMEILSLTIEDIDFQRRMIKPNKQHNSTKNTWVSFFNDEADIALRKYLASRDDSNPKLFPMCLDYFNSIWKRAKKKTGIHITAQVLREWFSSEMGRLGVPDRYVDAFQGRIPKSVLARHYTDYSPEKLRDL